MTIKQKAFRASANGAGYTAETPRAAAQKFFAEQPTRRKCTVLEGELDGAFFVLKFGVGGGRSWLEVTKKTLVDLPDNAEGVPPAVV